MFAFSSGEVFGQAPSLSRNALVDADGDGLSDSLTPRGSFGPPLQVQPFTVGAYIGSGFGGGPAFADRVEFLGFSVLRWTSPDQVTASSLAGVDVLFVYSGVEREIVGKDAIIADWVFLGNGLIVEQPNRSGNITILPPGLNIFITSQSFDGSGTGPDPVRAVHITSLGATHPIMFTLTDADISENFDTIFTSDVSSSFDILGVQATNNDLVAVAAAVFGEGRVVFHTGNTAPISFSPGSDQYLIQMINWAVGASPVGACCLSNGCEVLTQLA